MGACGESNKPNTVRLNVTVSSSNNNHISWGSSTGAGVVAVSHPSYEQHVPKYGQATLVALCLVLGCMIVATVLGNVFVIAAILIERSLQGVSNYLVLSLAVTDLLVAVLVMPLSLLNEVSVYWYLGQALCDMWVSMDVLCCTASILHLVAIAMDRFWAVSKIDYVRRRCAKQILLMIAIVWLVSVAISIPPLFGWKNEKDSPNLTGVCMISQDHGYTIFSTVGAFYCPLVLMLVLNFKIYRAARYRIRRKGFSKANSRKARGGHVTVPLVQVEQETTMRDPTRNSSGSDVSQDGISMFNPSCIVIHEMSRVDTGLDSYTADYDQQYSYYGGDSTTDSNQNDSYYPVAIDDPDSPSSPGPRFSLGGLSRQALGGQAGDRLCVDGGSLCHAAQLGANYRSFSSNQLTTVGPYQLTDPPCSRHLSTSDVTRCVSCDPIGSPQTLDVANSSYVEVSDMQLDMPNCDATSDNCTEKTESKVVVRDKCDATSINVCTENPRIEISVPSSDATSDVCVDNPPVLQCDANADCVENCPLAADCVDNCPLVADCVDNCPLVADCKKSADCVDSSSLVASTGLDCDSNPVGVEEQVPVEMVGPGCETNYRENRQVQFHTTVKIEGESEAMDYDHYATSCEDDDFGDEDDDLNLDEMIVDDDYVKSSPCGGNHLLKVELNCVMNHVHHNHTNHIHSNHISGHAGFKDCQKNGRDASDSGYRHIPSSQNNNSPNTLTTTTTTTSIPSTRDLAGGQQGNQLKVPHLGVLPGQRTRKARAANNNTKRARNREKEKQRREKLEMRRERKAARVLGIITGAFVLCWLPFFSMALLLPFLPAHCYVPPVIMSLFLWLGYFNSLINPIIYTIFNPSFRKAFRKIFFNRLSSVTRS